jgi:hypothetical protein
MQVPACKRSLSSAKDATMRTKWTWALLLIGANHTHRLPGRQALLMHIIITDDHSAVASKQQLMKTKGIEMTPGMCGF